MNKFLLVVALCLSSNFLFSQQKKLLWASKVLGYSSQFVDPEQAQSNQFKAVQVLGKPNKLPATGQSPTAWSPSKPDNPEGEWIKVGFEEPIEIKQIAIAENYNPGSITHIYAYDLSDQEFLLFRNLNVNPLVVEGRMLQIFQSTDYKVKAIKIQMNTAKILGYNQIDAIGIANYTEPLEAKINLSDKMSFKSRPENLGPNINSRYQEIAPMVAPDGKTIYYTRSNHPLNVGTEKQDVWFAEIKSDGTFGVAQNIGPPINNSLHNSSFSISPDGNTMLLNNVYIGEGKMEKGLSITNRTKTGWSIPQKVEIENYYNNNDYSEFCLSQDGKILLMTIQRNDTYGGKDIYFSRLQGNGSWSAPKNLGAMVNTAASETSPFLASDGESLYYSTGGLSGYGSNDIFVTRRLDDTWLNWSEPINLGPEINTALWDAYFSIPASADYAYFTSYSSSMGESDIFRVRLSDINKPKPVALIQGKVYNAKTKQPIQASIVYEILSSGENVGKATSNPQTGEYKVVLPLEKNYALLAEAKGFISVEENIDLTLVKEYKEITKDLYLVPIEKDATVRLNNIFFERTKYLLLPESYPELNRIIKLLTDNPTLVIQLEGHTEVFGKKSDQYELAENRVKNVKRYLVEKGGIDAKRIKLKSFGGSRPLSREVTEEARAMNRRVEIRILND